MKNRRRILLCGLLFCLMLVFSLSGTAEINKGVWYHQQPRSANDSGPFYGGASTYEGFCGTASVSMGLHYFVPNILAQLYSKYGEIDYHSSDGRGGLKDHDPYCYSRYRTYTFQDFLGHKYIGRHITTTGCSYSELRNVILGVANDLPGYTAQTAYITRAQMRDYLDNGWLMVMNVYPGHYVLVTGWDGSLSDPSQRYIYIYDPWDYPLGLDSSQYTYQRELAGNRPNYGAAQNLTAIRVTANTINSSSYFRDQRGDGTMLAFKLTPTNYPAAATEVGAKGVWLLGSTARTYGVANVVNTCAQRGVTDIFLMVKGNDGSYRVDTLNQVIQAAQPHGIKVHAWLSVLCDHEAASSGLYTTVGGDWIDARDVSYREYILDNIITPLLQCDIDGIHLDYIRYPGNANNYSGAQAAITTYCQEIRSLMNTVDPTLTLSAAIIAEGAGTAPYYGQNVANMTPYLQFIVPMTYTHAYKAAPSWVGDQISYFKSRAYPGCGVWAGIETLDSYGNYMTPLEMKQCVDYAVANNADGIAYFRYPLYSWQWEQSDSWSISSPVYFEEGRIISAVTDNNRYFAEDEVTVGITVKNTGNLNLVNSVVEWTIKDSNDKVKATGSEIISLLTPNSTETVEDSYQLPAEAPTGYWTVEYLFKTSSGTVLDSSSMYGNSPIAFVVEGENIGGRIVSHSTNNTHYYPADTVTVNAVIQNDGDCTLTNAKVKFEYVNTDDTVVDSSMQTISELGIGETTTINDEFTLGSIPLEVKGNWRVIITLLDSSGEVLDTRSDLVFNVYEVVSRTQFFTMVNGTANYMDNNYSGGYHTYPSYINVGDGRTVSLAQMFDLAARAVRYYENHGTFPDYITIRPVEGPPAAGDPYSWMWKDEGSSEDGSVYDNIAYLWNTQNYGPEYLHYINKAELLDASVRAATFVDNNGRLPNYNTIWNNYYSPHQWNAVPSCQFLYMMVRALRFMNNEGRWPNMVGIVHMTVPQTKAAWEQMEQSLYNGAIINQFTDNSHYFPAATVKTFATVKNTGTLPMENAEVKFTYINPKGIVEETSTHTISYLGVDESVTIDDEYVLGSVPLEVDGDWTVTVTFSTGSKQVLDNSSAGYNVYRTVSKAQYMDMAVRTADYMNNNYLNGYHTYPSYINVGDGRTVSLAQMFDLAARAIGHYENHGTFPDYITIRPVGGPPATGDPYSWMWKDEGSSEDGSVYDNIAYLWNTQNYGPEYLHYINKAELLDASVRAATFVDNNGRLPNYNTIWNNYYSPHQWNAVPSCQFLYMMVRALRFMNNEGRWPNMVGIVHMTVPQTKAAWEQGADGDGGVLKVAVFEHSGATSSNCVTQSVGILNDNGIQAQTINNTSIQQGGLSNFDVLILPGGSGTAIAEAIGQNGAAKIYDFVEAGGGVVGICAGAYYIVNGYNTPTSWLELIDADLLDVENWARGSGTVQVEVEAAGHPILSGYQGVFNAYYANGPLLDVPGGELPYEILCSFKSPVQSGAGIMVGTPALVTAGYGQGRCVWSSFHPELTSGLETMLVQAVVWAANH